MRSSLVLTTALAVLSLLDAAPSQAAWRLVGGLDIGVPPLAGVDLDPRVPGVLYARRGAAFTFDGGHLWKSEDGGSTWRNLQAGLQRPLRAIAIDPVDTRTLWVWTTMEGDVPRGALWRSDDRGTTWQRRYQAPSGPPAALADVRQLLADAADPQTLYRVDRVGDSVRVAVSRDGGASFALGALVPHAAPHDAIAVHGLRRELLAFSDSGLLASVDGGRSWQRRARFPRHGLVAGVLAPSRPDRIYAMPGPAGRTRPACLLRSDNAGGRWQYLPTPRIPGSRAAPRCDGLVVDPRDEDHLWVTVIPSVPTGFFAGISESIDGGRSWSPARALPGTNVRLSADHEGRLYAYGGQDYGAVLLRSDDDGGTWVPRDAGIVASDERAGLFAVPRADGAVRLVAGFGSLRFSDDRGSSWQFLPIAPLTNGLAHAGGEVLLTLYKGHRLDDWGVIRSADAGNSWGAVATPPERPIPGDFFQPAIVADRIDGRHVTVVGLLSDGPLPTGAARPWLSDDGGASWRPAGGLDTDCMPPAMSLCPHVHAYAVSSADPARRWISFDSRASSSPFVPRLHVTGDGGATWRLSAGLTLPVLSLLADPLVPGRVFAGTTEGLMVSEDSGELWHSQGQGLPATAAVRQLLRDGTNGALYAGTAAHGVYRSDDAGATWTRLEGEPDVDRPYLALDGSTPLAAFSGQGVWRWSP